jgi:hypothetical protein
MHERYGHGRVGRLGQGYRIKREKVLSPRQGLETPGYGTPENPFQGLKKLKTSAFNRSASSHSFERHPRRG